MSKKSTSYLALQRRIEDLYRGAVGGPCILGADECELCFLENIGGVIAGIKSMFPDTDKEGFRHLWYAWNLHQYETSTQCAEFLWEQGFRANGKNPRYDKDTREVEAKA